MRYISLILLFVAVLLTKTFSQQSQWKKIPLPENVKSITAIAKDGSGNLWLAFNFGDSIQKGIAVLNSSTNQWQLLDMGTYLNDKYILQIKLNKIDYSIWIATTGGILIYDGNNWRKISTQNSNLPSDEVGSIEFDKLGNIWLATTNGLVKISNTNEWTIFNTSNTQMKSQVILDVKADSHNNIWFTTSTWVYAPVGDTRPGQLINYDGKKFSYYTLSDQNLSGTIAISSKDSVWIGKPQYYSHRALVGGGISKLKADSTFTDYKYPQIMSNYVFQISFNKKDELYIASSYMRLGDVGNSSSGGLSVYKDGKVLNFTSSNSPLSYAKDFELSAMFVDNTDSVFVGYTYNGVTELAVYSPDIASDISNQGSSIKHYKLLQNYPNPFNPSTSINYSIPKNEYVKLKVYDILGKEVTTLVNKYQNVGSYTIKFDASSLPSGIYLYRLEAGNFTETRKLILIR